MIFKYAFSQSAVDVNGDLCEKEYIEADGWMESLKDRVFTQPQKEWSEDDESWLNDIIGYAEQEALLDKEQISWLKSLRLQSRWKPSDEQMEALWNVYQGGKEQAELATLYNDLKKLRNE